ncbi:MAG: C4-dicarboxylate ABC transporter substrate-binding protein [Desulfotalea sp.]|nr:MAG: C4-dicarboxylate ABC transporter substrate-binding protein [Desulfotalea sp.]
MKKSKAKKSRSRKTVKDVLKIYGFGIFLFVVIIAVAYQFVQPAPPRVLTIATASAEGAYYSFAGEYKELLAKEKIDLKVVKTSGSVENIQLLQAGEVDVAFVQGGVGKAEDFPDLVGLASLYLEPLVIFVRRGIEIETFADFAGKRIAIGKEGSGTRQIVQQLLDDNKLDTQDALEIVPLDGEEGAKALLAGDIDALFMVIRADADIVHELFLDNGVELVSLARAEAYSRLHKYLSHIVLVEGVLDMARNVPAKDYHLIAPAATLVATTHIHPALVDLLMQVITKVHDKASVLTVDQHYPSPENLDFPLSTEAQRFFKHGPPFLQRYLPFWAASLIDRLKFMILPLIALLIPLMKVLPPTYRWRIRSRIYRWYDELHDLDMQLKNDENIATLTEAITVVNAMEQEVREIEVPLSYSEELYNLRVHIDLLRSQFIRALEAQHKL